METSVSRYDFAPITGSETTDEGYLRVWCRAARTGIQTYRRADGSRVREYRPEEEVSSPDTLSSFGMKPVTWTHPPQLLDSTNAGEYQKGFSGSQVRFNDGFVEVALVVTDEDSIRRIKNKEAREVSAGYKVDYDDTPGVTPSGESYDGIQRNIRVNHIAIVPQGRAGPEVRLLLDRMDAADAVAEDEENPTPAHCSPASPNMATVKLDGMEIDLPTEAATAVTSHIREISNRSDSLASENAQLKERIDELQTDLDAAVLENQELTEARSDEQDDDDNSDRITIDAAELDALVAQRLDTLQALAPAFEDDFKFDGISDDDLYVQAFTNLTGSEPREDADFGYIRGAVDGILAIRADMEAEAEDEEEVDPEDEDEANLDSADEDRSDSTEGLQSVLRGSTVKAVRTDARSSYRERLAGQWKKPLTAHKSSN